MPPYDDDDQRRREYERELERQDDERRLEEDERERQRVVEEQERQRQREAEERQLDWGQARQQPPQSATGHPKGNGARRWNWRWARRMREEEHRRVREDDEKRWAAERDARRQRPFIALVFGGALLALLGFGAVRILGLYPAADELAVPLSPDEWPLNTPEWHHWEAPLPVEPDPVTEVMDRIEASTAQLTELRRSLSAIPEHHQRLGAELAELRSALDQARQHQKTWQNELQGQLATLAERLNAGSAWQTTTAQKLDELTLHVKVLSAPSAPAAQQTQTDAEATLPFRLVAIDVWNHVPYASLARRGEVERAAVGDAVAGWTVTAIDPARRQVVFQRNGRRLAQTVIR